MSAVKIDAQSFTERAMQYPVMRDRKDWRKSQ
jgi:hypothetical protein